VLDYYPQPFKFWLFEGKVGSIYNIIEELGLYEYYLVSKQYKWLLCENHHEVLYAVGEKMPEKLNKIKQGK